MSIQKKFNLWNSLTYLEQLQVNKSTKRYRNPKAISLLEQVLEYQNLTDKTMNGNTVMNLHVIEDELKGFTYVGAFNAVTNKYPDWSPLDLMYYMCFNYRDSEEIRTFAAEKNMQYHEIVGCTCGRILRALPSYIREYDMKNFLIKSFPDAKLSQNEDLDVKHHADLYMEIEGLKYYFWSFVRTQRGINNFKDKFLGNRKGKIKDGLHVICSFDLNSCAEIHGWKIYDDFNKKEVVTRVLKKTAIDYEKAAKKIEQEDFFTRTRIFKKGNIHV